MKCPKCGFTSFDHLQSCKQCNHDLSTHQARFSLRGLLGGTPPPVSPADTPDLSAPDPPATEESVETKRPGLRSLLARCRREPEPSADLPEVPADDAAPEELPFDATDLPQGDTLFDQKSAWKAREPHAGGDPPASSASPEPLPTGIPGDEEISAPVPEPEPLVDEPLATALDVPSSESPSGLPAPEECVEPKRPGPWRLLAFLRRDHVPPAGHPEMAAVGMAPEERSADASNRSQGAVPDMPPAQETGEPDDGLRRYSPAPVAEPPGAPADPLQPTPVEVTASEDTFAPAPQNKPEIPKALEPQSSSPELPLFDQPADDLQAPAAAPAETEVSAESPEKVDFSTLFADSEPEPAAGPGDVPPAGDGLPELRIEAPLPETDWSDSELPPLPGGTADPPPAEPLPVPTADLPCLEEPLIPERLDATETEEAEEAEKPPVAPHLVATLVDLAALGVVFALFVAAGQAALDPQPGALLASLLALSTPYFLVLFALCFGYFTLFHFLSGQTPGKMLARLRVEGEGGAPLLLSQAFLRSVGGLLCLLPLGLGFLPVVFDGERRGWNDRLAGTRVAHLPRGEVQNG